jgi:hypothetical protein
MFHVKQCSEGEWGRELGTMFHVEHGTKSYPC